MCRSNVTKAFLLEFLSTFKTYLSKSSNENLPCQIFQSIHSAIFWLGGFKNCAASLCDWCRARHRRQFNHHGAKVTISSYAFPFKKMPLWFNLQHESYLPRFQCVSMQTLIAKWQHFQKLLSYITDVIHITLPNDSYSSVSEFTELVVQKNNLMNTIGHIFLKWKIVPFHLVIDAIPFTKDKLIITGSRWKQSRMSLLLLI